MKTIIMIVAMLFAAGSASAQTKQSTSTKQKHSTNAKTYTCSMHPEVVKNKPGKCPKCQMDLTAVKSKKTTKQKTETKS
jgi:hypothetical protein